MISPFGLQNFDLCEHYSISAYALNILLLICLLIVWLNSRSHIREVLRITEYIRAMLRKDSARAPAQIQHRHTKALLRVIELFQRQAADSERRHQGGAKILDKSSELVANVDEIETAASSLNELLLQELAPFAVASAILLRSSPDKDLAIVNTKGLTEKRIASCLLMLFDRSSATSNWGIHVPDQNSLFDLRSLEISAHLMVPIGKDEQLIGAVWAGLRSGFFSLPPEQQAKLKTIVKHGAASLAASSKVRSVVEQSRRERSFLLGVSHDLKAPGNCALYALRSLISGELGETNPEQLLHLEIAENAIREQLSIISDVLDMARYEQGFLNVQPETFDPSSALHELMGLHRLPAETKGITIKLDIAVQTAIHFDPQHFRRILNNLLSNAIKYSDQGQISVCLSAANGTLYIEVSDRGIGVPLDQVGALFSEFERMSNSLGRCGVGLGLAISKIMAKLNNAELSYKPNQPQGSVFTLSLNDPTFVVAQNSTQSGPPPEPYSSLGNITPTVNTPHGLSPGSSKRILIIEDDPGVARNYIRYLQPYNLTIDVASSLSEGTAKILEFRPELIISDLHLGETDPILLIMELDRLAPITPKLFITGSSAECLIEHCAKRKLTRIMTKPVERGELSQIVLGALARNSVMDSEERRSGKEQVEIQ